MTNEKEAPEWYEDGKYWVPQPERYGHHWPKLNEIVAEAMRRGEVKAWEEAKQMIIDYSEGDTKQTMLSAEYLIAEIDYEIKSLK